MKRKAEEQDIISLRASKKFRVEETTDATMTPWDVWRAIEYFCDMNTLHQLTMTCKAFSSFFWDESYKKYYIWRWKHNFIMAKELPNYAIDYLIKELTIKSQQSIYAGSSNFVDPALLKTKTPWRTRYNHRLTLLPNLVSLGRIYADWNIEEATESKIVVYDRTREQHEQEETRFQMKKQQEEQQKPFRSRRSPGDQFANLPKSLEFVFIGPSTAPVTIKTEISSENREQWYFKASIWSYLTNTWCELLIHRHTGQCLQEQFHAVCYPVTSLLCGKKIERNDFTSEYECQLFRHFVAKVSQMPHGAYTSEYVFIAKEDESMERLFE